MKLYTEQKNATRAIFHTTKINLLPKQLNMVKRSRLVYVYKVFIHPVRQILEGVVVGDLLHGHTLLVGDDRAHGMH